MAKTQIQQCSSPQAARFFVGVKPKHLDSKIFIENPHVHPCPALLHCAGTLATGTEPQGCRSGVRGQRSFHGVEAPGRPGRVCSWGLLPRGFADDYS